MTDPLSPKRETILIQRDAAQIRRIRREIAERKREEQDEAEQTHQEWLQEHHSRQALH